MYISSEIDQVLKAEVPEKFLSDMVANTFLAFESADGIMRSELESFQAHDVIGHMRRAKWEGNFRGAAELHGLGAEEVRVADGRSVHIEVISPSFRFVGNLVEAPGMLPRHANFRHTLASSGQLWFADLGPSGSSDRIMGVLAYTRSVWPTADDRRKWGHLPGSLQLLFPDSTHRSVVHRIDLFSRYQSVVRRHTPADWSMPVFLRYIDRARRSAAA